MAHEVKWMLGTRLDKFEEENVGRIYISQARWSF
jgi:hypothetical protein